MSIYTRAVHGSYYINVRATDDVSAKSIMERVSIKIRMRVDVQNEQGFQHGYLVVFIVQHHVNGIPVGTTAVHV